MVPTFKLPVAVGQKFLTRCGKIATIVSIDYDFLFAIKGIIESEEWSASLKQMIPTTYDTSWFIDGLWEGDSHKHPYDLIEVFA